MCGKVKLPTLLHYQVNEVQIRFDYVWVDSTPESRAAVKSLEKQLTGGAHEPLDCGGYFTFKAGDKCSLTVFLTVNKRQPYHFICVCVFVKVN